VLTMVGGNVVYSAAPFGNMAPRADTGGKQ
jgi:hypothetical protein